MMLISDFELRIAKFWDEKTRTKQISSDSRFKMNFQSAIRHCKFAILAAAFLFALCAFADAQQPKVYRVGVLLPGEAWYEIIDGLRVGLKELGLEESKQYALAIRDWLGDAKAAETAAKNFEQEKVNLIY